MPWLQLFIEVNQAYADPVAEYLAEQGAQAITYKDAQDKPVFEPAPGEIPLWQNVILSALFNKNDDVVAIFKQLNQQFPDRIKQHKIRRLKDQNWTRAWMKDFQEMKFGQNLYICPSGQPPSDPKAINILLDPGLAFGSGSHETTALCLRWLDNLSLQHKTVIDYGCGSGILAIAAIKLGARQALGVDADPQAIIASRENANRNGITTKQLSLRKVDATHPASLPATDVLIANILAEPLRLLAPCLASLVKPTGQIGLSGILSEQVDEICEFYSPWFDLAATISDGDWSFISGTKKSN